MAAKEQGGMEVVRRARGLDVRRSEKSSEAGEHGLDHLAC
jgi:hypothetical protein